MTKLKEQNEKLIRMLESEKQKAKAYNKIFQIHSAYVAILLKKMGADKDNAVTLTTEEVMSAKEKLEARATVEAEGVYKLFYEEIGD